MTTHHPETLPKETNLQLQELGMTKAVHLMGVHSHMIKLDK